MRGMAGSIGEDRVKTGEANAVKFTKQELWLSKAPNDTKEVDGF